LIAIWHETCANNVSACMAKSTAASMLMCGWSRAAVMPGVGYDPKRDD
jgi:hypothetical protein